VLSIFVRDALREGRTGCSQTEHTLAVCEMDAPQCGQERCPLSLGLSTAVGSDLRFGAASASPHIKQVRAEALTSAPHCGQWR
jgi:hypothetical protein